LTSLFFRSAQFLVAASLLVILLARFIAIGSGTDRDLLAYSIGGFGEPASLLLYDLGNAVKTQIFSTSDTITFSLSADGRIAYTSRASGDSEIDILDTRASDPTAVNITNSPTTQEYPSSWSPDGRYLAFVSSEKETLQLYLWDGESVVNITPNDTPDTIQSYQVTWSPDGRLAFTVRYGFNVDQNTEIYLWDGKTTTNLSQNPAGRDESPVWNIDGRVAFLSRYDEVYDIYVWDGMSLKNGSPDFGTFTNAAPELTGYMSSPIWTDEGLLSFVGFGPQNKNARLQFYVWDGQTATNMSQKSMPENGVPYWSRDGRWAFVPYFSPLPLVSVYDTDNRLLLNVPTRSGPAWSSDGYLMFCTPKKELAVWDGRLIVKLTQGGEIVAKWDNGGGVVCAGG